MYKGKKILAFIPARYGSKRVKHKNIRMINGIPLFQYSVLCAKESKYIDDIIVSSDSNKILKIAHELGCIKNQLRPDDLSNDTARIIDAVLYELEKNNLKDYDTLVLLQPTFPTRTVDLIDEAIEAYFTDEEDLITVVEAKEQPLMMRTIVNNKLNKIIDVSSDIRSQDFPKVYKILGCIYINKIDKLKHETVFNENSKPFIIDNKYDIDIDTIDDFKRAVKEIKKK